MSYDLTLGTDTAQLADALEIRSPQTEKTDQEQNQETKTALPQGDVVTISEEARALAAPEESGDAGKSRSEEKQDQLIQQLKDRIEKLEEEIEEIEQSDLSEKDKLSQIQNKQAQLMQLEEQLAEAQATQAKMAGLSTGGGTRATGFGNSLETF